MKDERFLHLCERLKMRGKYEEPGTDSVPSTYKSLNDSTSREQQWT